MDCYVLNIWIRDDYGKSNPTLVLASRTEELLENAYKNYIRLHRDDEDYMEDDEFEEMLKDLNLKNLGPELNCAYEITVYKTTNVDIQ